jgi:hypothetical protein
MQSTVSLFRGLFGSDEAVPLPHFKKMNHEDRKLLAEILSHQPPPTTTQASSMWVSYRLITKRLIAELPGHLRSYPNKIERFLNKHIEDDARSQMRALCPQHDKLNRRVVRTTLAWIKREIDINIPAIIDPLEKAGHLTPSDCKLFNRLLDTSGMWVDSQSFKKFFGRSVHPKWSRQADRCAACVVSRLAGDSKVVMALYAGMLIGHSNPGESRRLDYVACMLDRLGEPDAVRLQAQELGWRLHAKFRQWEEGQNEAIEERDRVVPNAQAAAARYSMSQDFAPIAEPIQRPATPRYTPQRQPSLTRPHSRRESRPVSPKSGVYEPIPWREPQYPPKPPQRRARRRSTVGDLIEAYRQTTYEPALGHEDHFGFKEEDEVEEWPSADMIQEILALHQKNHAERLAAEAAGVPNARDPPPPVGGFRLTTARWDMPAAQGRQESASVGRRESASVRRRDFAPEQPRDFARGGLQEFAPGGHQSFPPVDRRVSESVYGDCPPTEAGPRSRGRRTSARMNVDELAEEYQRVVGQTNPFRRDTATSVASNITLWPRFSNGAYSFK